VRATYTSGAAASCRGDDPGPALGGGSRRPGLIAVDPGPAARAHRACCRRCFVARYTRVFRAECAGYAAGRLQDAYTAPMPPVQGYRLYCIAASRQGCDQYPVMHHARACTIANASMIRFAWVRILRTAESILAVDHDLAMPADGHSECDRYTAVIRSDGAARAPEGAPRKGAPASRTTEFASATGW
jgi:hypothetical protein